LERRALERDIQFVDEIKERIDRENPMLNYFITHYLTDLKEGKPLSEKDQDRLMGCFLCYELLRRQSESYQMEI